MTARIWAVAAAAAVAVAANDAALAQASVAGAAMGSAMAPARAPMASASATARAPMADASATAPPGYLAGKPPVEILKVLPPPPLRDSAQDIADRTVYAASAQGIDGPAWNAAVSELNPTSPAYFAKLSCAVSAVISPQTTPVTMAMIARAGVDFVTPMTSAKMHFKRLRPFTTDKGRACDPISNDGVGADLGYSYPSGHAGIGWLWAILLSDAAPARATAIRDFGRDTGDLRIACRVHWLSDVSAGRLLAATVYGRLAAEPAFRADAARARAELAAAPVPVCP